MAPYTLLVNGGTRTIEADDPAKPLLYVLRGDLGLTAAKFGCGLGQCGACTVLVDGAALRSCQLAVSDAVGKTITTLEGLAPPEHPHPVQAAFIAEAAAQCGYCTNGMVLTAKALLDQNPHPTRAEITDGLADNLCRCGTHTRIVRAVLRAAGQG
ncbi:MAG TPA: (2Fe-2S)-binding protein [Stellaceae bacterium]|nr:(2Fe-2S)-binding protein [Stellaceae bacterium]